MSIVLSILLQTAPLFIAAAGGLLSELSGRLNIGLEGAILFGAFFSALMFQALGSLPPAPAAIIALTAALASGLASGGITAALSIRRGANVFIVGLGNNLLAWGLIPLLSQMILGSKGIISLQAGSAFKSGMAWSALFAAVIIGGGLHFFLEYHSRGLRLRKIYLDEYSARLQGTDVPRYREWSLTLSSGLAALAGGFIALQLGSYVPNLSAGKGWIALVIIYLGNRRLLPMTAAALVFAFSQFLANEAQRFLQAPGILIGLPYLITLLALVIYQLLRKAVRRD